MFYRIPKTLYNGPITIYNQLNYIHGIIKPESKYRMKILDEIVDYVHKQNDVDNILIAGDLNSALSEDEIIIFFNRIGVTDIFSHLHQISVDQRLHLFIRGKECIDTVSGSEGILEFFSRV